MLVEYNDDQALTIMLDKLAHFGFLMTLQGTVVNALSAKKLCPFEELALEPRSAWHLSAALCALAAKLPFCAPPSFA